MPRSDDARQPFQPCSPRPTLQSGAAGWAGPSEVTAAEAGSPWSSPAFGFTSRRAGGYRTAIGTVREEALLIDSPSPQNEEM